MILNFFFFEKRHFYILIAQVNFGNNKQVNFGINKLTVFQNKFDHNIVSIHQNLMVETKISIINAIQKNDVSLLEKANLSDSKESIFSLPYF